MERMCIPVDPPVQCSTETKPPMYSDFTLPKKDPDHKVFVIKLPLDIDIRIHHHHRAVILLVVLPWISLIALLLYLMSSLQQQFQLYEIEIATLKIQSSQLSMQTFEIQNQLTQMEAVLQNVNLGEGIVRKMLRRKRETENEQTAAVIAEYKVSQSPQQDPPNDTVKVNMETPEGPNHSTNGIVFGQIGPWYEDQQAVGDFGLRNCNLRDRGVKLIVNETGLYLIYAQVYYLATRSLNSYSINVFPGNKPASIPVAFCSANASVNDHGSSEVSCFTSVVRKLQAGDGISLQQLERQRRLVMRDGRTFIGLVRLG